MRFSLTVAAAGLAAVGSNAAAVANKPASKAVGPVTIPAKDRPAAVQKLVKIMKDKKPKAPKQVKVVSVTAAAPTALVTKAATKNTARGLFARGDCDVETYNNPDQSFKGSMEEFLNYAPYQQKSNAAATPNGYNAAYTNFIYSLEDPSYITYTDEAAYDPAICAAKCDAMGQQCQSFDIYYERDPSQSPAAACPNPEMRTAIKCAYYGAKLQPSWATNAGQWRNGFAVVITGGNGYVKRDFRILAATFADQPLSGADGWLSASGDELNINTNYPNSVLTNDPWNNGYRKSVDVLYSWHDEIRIFSQLTDSGSFKQTNAPYSATTAPGSTLAAGVSIPSKSTVQYIALVYGSKQFTDASFYDRIYSLAGSSFTTTNDQFGDDPNYGVQKSASFFYKTAAGAYTSSIAREGGQMPIY